MKYLLAALISFFSSLALATEITVRDVYIPLMPPASHTYAMYMTISNSGERTRAMVGINAEGFVAAHFHQSDNKDGVVRMHALKEVTLAAGKTVSMTPGGLHVMLMKPQFDLNQGDTVAIQITLSDGEVISTVATLKRVG